jgi:hypothetical protein
MTIGELSFMLVCAPCLTWSKRHLSYFIFQSFEYERNLMEVIPEKRVCLKLDIWAFMTKHIW